MTWKFPSTSSSSWAVTLILASSAMWSAAALAEDHAVLGAGVALTPYYEGAEDHRVLPIPIIDIKEGWFFANLRNGIGIEPIETEHFSAGLSAVFIQGYRRRDVPVGLDKLKSGVGARGFASVRGAGIIGTLGVTQIVSGGTEGLIGDASVSYPIPLSSRFILTPTLGLTWANAKHMDGYFGVSAVESLASGLPSYSADAGIKDFSAALTATYRITDRLTLSVTGSATSLRGDAKNSPMIGRKTQTFGLASLSWRLY